MQCRMCHVSLLVADSHLGLLGFEIETGAAVNSAGQTSKQFFDMGNDPDKDAMEESADWRRRLLAWMDDGKAGSAPLFEPWRSFQHPQLGPVEIGGIHSTAAANPVISSAEFLSLLKSFHDFTVLAARMAPRVLCEAVHVDRIAGDAAAGGSVCFRVRAKVANRVSAGLK